MFFKKLHRKCHTSVLAMYVYNPVSNTLYLAMSLPCNLPRRKMIQMQTKPNTANSDWLPRKNKFIEHWTTESAC